MWLGIIVGECHRGWALTWQWGCVTSRGSGCVPAKGVGPARSAVGFTPPLLDFLHGLHAARTAVVFSPPRVCLHCWHWEVGPMRMVVGFSPPRSGAPRWLHVTVNPSWYGHSPGGSTTTEGGGGGEERDGFRFTNQCLLNSNHVNLVT